MMPTQQRKLIPFRTQPRGPLELLECSVCGSTRVGQPRGRGLVRRYIQLVKTDVNL